MFEDRRRDPDVVDHLRRRPAPVAAPRDELPLAQAADDLEHEERVPVGLRGDPHAELLREPLGLERVLEKRIEILRSQARDRDRPVGLADGARPVGRLRGGYLSSGRVGKESHQVREEALRPPRFALEHTLFSPSPACGRGSG